MRFSPEYVIGGSAYFQVKVFNILRFLRFGKLHTNHDLTYTIHVTSDVLRININFISNDGTWQLFDERYPYPDQFDLTVVMDVVPGASSFTPLHEDLELTDFEFKGEGGSVRMHRAVLAASSPVLRRMLAGSWREGTEDSVNVPSTSMLTLQHFKYYVY